jgi:hypothetical protein
VPVWAAAISVDLVHCLRHVGCVPVEVKLVAEFPQPPADPPRCAVLGEEDGLVSGIDRLV